jgi:hypothetical protein
VSSSIGWGIAAASGRHLLAGLFVLAACGKVASRSRWLAFMQTVEALIPRVQGRAMARPIGAAVIASEFLAAIAVVTPPLRTAGSGAHQAVVVTGLLAMVSLLSGFSIAMVLGLRRKIHIPCNCFGANPTMISAASVVRNGALAALTVSVAVSVPRAASLDDVQMAIAVGPAVIALMMITLWGEITYLVRPQISRGA